MGLNIFYLQHLNIFYILNELRFVILLVRIYLVYKLPRFNMVSHASDVLSTLSTELLLKIFSYVDLCDLCNLRQTCKRFNIVINSWDHVLLTSGSPVVTNQESRIFLSRCLHQLSTIEKIRISRNWKIGRYFEKSLLFVRQKYIPWLHLCSESVWMSRGKKIFNYERTNNHINVKRPNIILQGRSNADVGNFRIKNQFIVSGQSDGSMWLRTLDDRKIIFDNTNCHNSDIHSVDISQCGKTIASGERNNCFKIWQVDYEFDTLKESHCRNIQDRVWRVSLLDEKPLLAVGTSGNAYINSLFIYDLERISDPTELPSSSKFGMGVVDLKWDGPHTLWSCGYDCYLKRWDLRTGGIVQMFSDPFNAALYCLDYDYVNTIMTGTQLHGRVILWDKRQSNSVQFYFMESCKSSRSSPVYSLSFDSKYLFTATTQHLNVLNFSTYNGIVRDYSIHY